MATLARPTIANAGRFQVCFEESVPHDKIAEVRQAALDVHERKVQLVLADGLVVTLDDIHRVHGPELVDRVQLAQGIPRQLQQTHLARRTPSFRHAIGLVHLRKQLLGAVGMRAEDPLDSHPCERIWRLRARQLPQPIRVFAER